MTAGRARPFSVAKKLANRPDPSAARRSVTVIPHVKSRESDFCDNDGVCLRKWKEELEAVAKIPGATPKAMVAGRCRYCLRGLKQ